MNDLAVNRKVVCFCANRGYALTSSRLSYIQHFLDEGYQVVVASTEDKESLKLKEMGCHLEIVMFDRGGLALWNDLYCIRRLCQIFIRWRPSLILLFHAKPVILGNLLAALLFRNKTRTLSVITGLGHAFIAGGWIRNLAGLGYWASLRFASAVVFQNQDDMKLFLKQGWVSEVVTYYIPGSGVNTDRFTPSKRIKKNQVVMLGRLIGQKGVREFIDVASYINKLRSDVQFVWAGEVDERHPDSVSPSIFGGVENLKYLGQVDDVKSLLSDSALLLFPSYREGMPRAVMEAASMGIPAVGFDVPGVREVVLDRETGILVPFGDLTQLRQKVSELLESNTLREEMGWRARELMKSKFDSRVIEKSYFSLFSQLGF